MNIVKRRDKAGSGQVIRMTRRCICTVIAVVVVTLSGYSQTVPVSSYFPDIKIMNSNGPSPGYFFLATQAVTAPGAQRYIAIVDNYGTPVFFRLMPAVTISMRLLKDGTIGYSHGVPRKLYLLDDMLDVKEVISTLGYNLDGHDWDIDDDGNYNRLLFAKYNRVVDMSQLISGGNPAAVINEHVIQELDINKNLLHQWRTEDMFNILDANVESPFVDFLASSIDYAHLNSASIVSDTTFFLSTRHLDEITKVDRRTGEVIWRLGGKKNQFTFINDTIRFSHQHCPRIMPNGNILIFDNGNIRTPQFSSVVEYQLDEVNMTATLVNRFRRFPDAFSPRDGASQRLPNGNTIATWGPGWPSLTEFHPDGSVAIELDFTEHSLSPRIEKFLWKTTVFETSVDDLDFGMWDGNSPVERRITLKNNADTTMHITGYSTRTGHFSMLTELPVALLPGVETEIALLFNPVLPATGYLHDVITISSDNNTQRIARQVNLTGRHTDRSEPVMTIMPDSINVPTDALITLAFSEPVRRDDGAELNYDNVDQLVLLRKNSANGEAVAFNATINTTKTLIEVRPDRKLDEGTVYWVSITDNFEDYSGNRFGGSIGTTFTTAGVPTGVKVETPRPFFSVYPNPGQGKFNLVTDYKGETVIEVYSNLGVSVYGRRSFQGPDFTIDLEGKEPGLYLVVIRSSEGLLLTTRRLIITY
jgi:hypothetical protein